MEGTREEGKKEGRQWEGQGGGGEGSAQEKQEESGEIVREGKRKDEEGKREGYKRKISEAMKIGRVV